MKSLNWTIKNGIVVFLFCLSGSISASLFSSDCKRAFTKTAKKKAFKELKASIAHLNYKDIESMSPLQVIAMGTMITVIKAWKPKLDINAQDSRDGQSLLHLIAKVGTIDQIKPAYELGAKLNATDNNGDSPLHIATRFGNINAIKALIGLGAKINAKNNLKQTPLHVATLEKKLDIVEILLHNGADPYIKDLNKNTAMDLAPDYILEAFEIRGFNKNFFSRWGVIIPIPFFSGDF